MDSQLGHDAQVALEEQTIDGGPKAEVGQVGRWGRSHRKLAGADNISVGEDHLEAGDVLVVDSRGNETHSPIQCLKGIRKKYSRTHKGGTILLTLPTTLPQPRDAVLGQTLSFLSTQYA